MPEAYGVTISPKLEYPPLVSKSLESLPQAIEYHNLLKKMYESIEETSDTEYSEKSKEDDAREKSKQSSKRTT